MSDTRIAIFITGPLRYIDKVIKSLEKYREALNFDIFVHVWKEDNSNKKRVDEADLNRIFELSQKIHTLIVDTPPSNEYIAQQYGDWTDTHSTAGAMFSMFSAINKLIQSLESDPCGNKYTHILRIRTDVAILNKDFFSGIDWESNKIYTSDNKVIQPAWISDHLMLAKAKEFKKIWKFDNFQNFERAFSNKARNPEFFLKFRIKHKDLVKHWIRYLDYHVVYNPPKKADPLLLNNLQLESGVEGIFSLTLSSEQKAAIERHNEKLASHYIGYYKTKYLIRRFFKRLRNKKKAV
ncbi:hypothetical protein [Agarivorans sp. Alg241-V36]|uniref:hypothetical protein n=1 Tax=Agarivorans sp. Alg241-V36 TaxID=2305992 RepID=UPI0013D7C4DE|nr:hypothetical protein [Agarivorans sp. Alg241-V36]